MLILLFACTGPPKDSDDAVTDPRASCIADNVGSRYGNADLAALSSGCTALGGTNCNNTWITKPAAVCIAELEGLAEGISDWISNLDFDTTFRRVSWTVSSTEETVTVSTTYDRYPVGQSLLIDGTTGELLQRSEWEGRP